MDSLEMIEYTKCGNGIEMVGISNDNDVRLEWHAEKQWNG